jgi:hypothetical protein
MIANPTCCIPLRLSLRRHDLTTELPLAPLLHSYISGFVLFFILINEF